MIEVAERIRHAATDPTLRAAARVLWQQQAPLLFEDQPRKGLRVSDVGSCRRALWAELHVAPKVFSPDVQLFNLDEGTMTGCWWAVLLAASLEADGYYVELEPTVERDGVPGHIDLYYEGDVFPAIPGETRRRGGVIEFKKSWSYKPEPQRWHVLQLGSYMEAKGCEEGAIVSIAPVAKGEKCAVTWYRLDDEWKWTNLKEWTNHDRPMTIREAVAAEWERLQGAAGEQEPVEDAIEAFRCKGCPVLACARNPLYVADTASQLAESLGL